LQSCSSLSIPPNPFEELLSGVVSWVYQSPEGQFHTSGKGPRYLLAGSFNPLHVGHTRMAELAQQRFGIGVDFEISIANVDKPMLTREVIEARATQFRERAGLYLTVAPTFIEKARLFPQCCFVIGADTALRIIDPRYYQHDPTRRDNALEEIRTLGGSFLLFGRTLEGVFQTGENLNLPERYSDLFTFLSEEDFREDISSTQIRKSGELTVKNKTISDLKWDS